HSSSPSCTAPPGIVLFTAVVRALSTNMEPHNPNLTCAICLDRFKIPVTIPCGHTFCKDCINAHWDTKIQSGIGPQCPICNEKFPTRPSLKRNVSLSVLAEAENSTFRKPCFRVLRQDSCSRSFRYDRPVNKRQTNMVETR
uniref:RING-type domain-containing protein n=1 Tax=Kryptolebias marmoratus TaxID=37003 RepID=A0A3Q3ELQ8_KRYMA